MKLYNFSLLIYMYSHSSVANCTRSTHSDKCSILDIVFMECRPTQYCRWPVVYYHKRKYHTMWTYKAVSNHSILLKGDKPSLCTQL